MSRIDRSFARARRLLAPLLAAAVSANAVIPQGFMLSYDAVEGLRVTLCSGVAGAGGAGGHAGHGGHADHAGAGAHAGPAVPVGEGKAPNHDLHAAHAHHAGAPAAVAAVDPVALAESGAGVDREHSGHPHHGHQGHAPTEAGFPTPEGFAPEGSHHPAASHAGLPQPSDDETGAVEHHPCPFAVAAAPLLGSGTRPTVASPRGEEALVLLAGETLSLPNGVPAAAPAPARGPPSLLA